MLDEMSDLLPKCVDKNGKAEGLSLGEGTVQRKEEMVFRDVGQKGGVKIGKGRMRRWEGEDGKEEEVKEEGETREDA